MLITGTPGTGKTTLASQVAAATGLKHFNIGDLVKAEQLHTGWDDEFNCLVIDEDKVRRWGRTPLRRPSAAASVCSSRSFVLASAS